MNIDQCMKITGVKDIINIKIPGVKESIDLKRPSTKIAGVLQDFSL
jgi:hypothetical protein